MGLLFSESRKHAAGAGSRRGAEFVEGPVMSGMQWRCPES